MNGGGCLLLRCLPHGGNQCGSEHNQCVETPAAQNLPYRLCASRIAGKSSGVAQFTRFIQDLAIVESCACSFACSTLPNSAFRLWVMCSRENKADLH